jgi:hypothetical protein
MLSAHCRPETETSSERTAGGTAIRNRSLYARFWRFALMRGSTRQQAFAATAGGRYRVRLQFDGSSPTRTSSVAPSADQRVLHVAGQVCGRKHGIQGCCSGPNWIGCGPNQAQVRPPPWESECSIGIESSLKLGCRGSLHRKVYMLRTAAVRN